MTAASSLRFTGLLLLLVLPFSAVRGDTASGTIPWRSLPHVQRTLGATHHVWDGETICFSNSQNVISVLSGRRKADVNGTVVWLNAPVEGSVADGSWRLAAVISTCCNWPFCSRLQTASLRSRCVFCFRPWPRR